MLYVAGGLIVVAAAYSVVSLQAISQSTDLVFRERLIATGAVAREIDGDLNHLQIEVKNLGNIISADLANNRPNQAQEDIDALYQHWSLYDHFRADNAIILLDPKGAVLGSDPPLTGQSARYYASLPAFQAVLQSSQPVIFDDVSMDSGEEHGSLLLFDPILVSGRPAGVLIADFSLTQISQSFVSMLDTDKSGYNQALINENGLVIASTQPSYQLKLEDHFTLVKDLLVRKQSSTLTHQMPITSNEPSHIVTFVPLQSVPWGVVVEEPQDAALALPHALENRLFIFGAIALLAGLVLAFVTTRAVVQPVNALINVTQRIAAGDLNHPLDVTAEDEVGRLARSFDDMRAELKESHEEIALWNRELEARVNQRTRELSALVKSSQALATTLNLDVLFDILIHQTLEVVPLTEGIIFFQFDQSRELLLARSTFGLDEEACRRLGFQVGEGIAGQVFQAQTPLRLGLAEAINAAQGNLSPVNCAYLERALGERPVKSALGAPLISKGAPLGALVLFNLSREDAFTENDVTVLQAFANQAAAAIENAGLYASLQEKEAARAALLDQVIQAQEEERARVAREIHDELGQLLTRLSIDLKMCETQITAQPGQAAQTLAATQTLVWRTMEQTHRLIVELRPTLLDELGLEAALGEELATRLGPLGVTTRVEADSVPERLPAPVEITIFRIAQEAISNIALHAHAQRATISLLAGSDLRVRIEDDGVGIRGDWQSAANGHRPLGLLGMQERAALIGGTLTIEPCASQGTCVTLRVPLVGDVPAKEKAA